MAYTVENFKSKKALKQAVAAGVPVRIYNPGLGTPKSDGVEFLEGPHFPALHTWYAQAVMKNGVVQSVK